MESLGMKAVLPPPEEVKDVKTRLALHEHKMPESEMM